MKILAFKSLNLDFLCLLVNSNEIFGSRLWVNHANGTRTDYAYDERNRLMELTHGDSLGTPFSQQTYTRAETGHKTSLTELDGRTVDYTYDDLYRLIEERTTDAGRGNRTTSWTFDAVGNRQTQIDNGVLTSYVYDNNDRLLEENGSEGLVTYRYDQNGNTLEKQINGLIDTTYAYDSQDRLIQADTPTATLNYTYDAMGINGALTEFLVDSNRQYAQIIEETSPSETILYLRGDELISQESAGITSTYHADGQGSTKALTDVAGAATDQFIYTAYGEVEHREGMTDSDFLYTGEQFDAGLGFYYLRARYYNPSNGRFPTMDTYQGRVGEPQTLHKYLYVHGDPVNLVDPSGQFSIGGLLSSVGNTLLRLGRVVPNVARAVAARPINGVPVRGFSLANRIWLQINVRSVQRKIPKELFGKGTAANKGAGWKWKARKKGFDIRVQRGNPKSSFPAQRSDYVKLTVEGKVIGRNGQVLTSGKVGEAHIPLWEWRTWSSWRSPF